MSQRRSKRIANSTAPMQHDAIVDKVLLGQRHIVGIYDERGNLSLHQPNLEESMNGINRDKHSNPENDTAPVNFAAVTWDDLEAEENNMEIGHGERFTGLSDSMQCIPEEPEPLLKKKKFGIKIKPRYREHIEDIEILWEKPEEAPRFSSYTPKKTTTPGEICDYCDSENEEVEVLYEGPSLSQQSLVLRCPQPNKHVQKPFH